MKKMLLLFLLAFNAQAQTYPSRPVKLVVPFPAGSATDQIARVIGQQLQETLSQPFVVENKPGAQGSIAASEVARAAPDGYTLMVGTNTPLAANPSLFKKLSYDPAKDFAPIARLGTISFMIMVRPDFPAKNFKEFLAHAKANPGKLSAGYGSAGSQVSQAMLRSMGKIDFIDVPYKGLPQAITDVLGGSVSFTFADLANALAQMKGGKLRGIAVTSAKRSPLAADIPAIAEELPGYELIAWFALVAPAGTPAPVIQSINRELLRTFNAVDVQEQVIATGSQIVGGRPDDFAVFIRGEIAKWSKVIKAAGIPAE
jgi:tripartite-type tricarboxylate transporter receptor subunit TctC